MEEVKILIDLIASEEVQQGLVAISSITGIPVIGQVALGIGSAYAGLVTVASFICAKTKTRDNKFYKLVEYVAFNNETAKQKVEDTKK